MKKIKDKICNNQHSLLWKWLKTGVSLLSLIFLNSCTQDINLAVVSGATEIVIEGKIENGETAEVYVMRSSPLSPPPGYNYKDSAFVINATVTVSDGTISETCPIVTTIDSASTYFFPYKGKTIIGAPGKTYFLTVVADGKTLTATTTIPTPIPLDSVWWKAQSPYDTLGYAWGHLTEPVGLGNAYKWYAKRANKWYQPMDRTIHPSPYGYQPREKPDRRYLAPRGSTFDDKFIDGTSFDLFYSRGIDPSDSLSQTDITGLNNYFKKTDTIHIKFCSIDHNTAQFYSTYEAASETNGNPFASPVTIISNIKGGLGVWAGFGCSYYTIYPK